ncbi:MAG: A1 family peptidase [Bifidobacteriaceae bacterium]|jgi:hypothetical protein|nr:A1 family peptidase [Bifidobacteriaceae bacterium]
MPELDGVLFNLSRGDFQNNGASPWYTELGFGTPPQRLKVNIDSGTDITWLTSTLCPPESCQHTSGGRFDYRASSTFSFTDCLQRPFSFGAWGTMQVEAGQDVVELPDPAGTRSMQLFFSADYAGSQFAQLDWDGGIGLPSSSAYVEGRTSFLLQLLMESRTVRLPFVSFDTDYRSRQGTCQIGGVDPSKYDPTSSVFLPWKVYDVYPGSEYLWGADLYRLMVGDVEIAPGTPKVFATDSGSSQFKGDDDIMNAILTQIARQGSPPVRLELYGGRITVTPDMYNVYIEAGPDAGKTIPQFQGLGMSQLVLVGSVLMDYCYTVFRYDVHICSPGALSLSPVGVYFFNKIGGPQIISGRPVEFPTRIPAHKGRGAFGREIPFERGWEF